MVLLPETVIQLLRAGGSVRLTTQGLLPDTMVRYARAARAGRAKVTFVVEGPLLAETMIRIAQAGGGSAEFDISRS